MRFFYAMRHECALIHIINEKQSLRTGASGVYAKPPRRRIGSAKEHRIWPIPAGRKLRQGTGGQCQGSLKRISTTVVVRGVLIGRLESRDRLTAVALQADVADRQISSPFSNADARFRISVSKRPQSSHSVLGILDPPRTHCRSTTARRAIAVVPLMQLRIASAGYPFVAATLSSVSITNPTGGRFL